MTETGVSQVGSIRNFVLSMSFVFQDRKSGALNRYNLWNQLDLANRKFWKSQRTDRTHLPSFAALRFNPYLDFHYQLPIVRSVASCGLLSCVRHGIASAIKSFGNSFHKASCCFACRPLWRKLDTCVPSIITTDKPRPHDTQHRRRQLNPIWKVSVFNSEWNWPCPIDRCTLVPT